jgi:UDP-sugar pyrophosphorylase
LWHEAKCGADGPLASTGESDEQKRGFLSQLQHLDKNYSGGLATYIKNAKRLLEDSKLGK